MNINERLKQLREDKDISIYKLSRITDVSENHIRSIEHGKSQPTVLTLEKLLPGLGTNLAEFFNDNNQVFYPTEIEIELLHAIRQISREQVEALVHLAKLMNQQQ